MIGGFTGYSSIIVARSSKKLPLNSACGQILRLKNRQSTMNYIWSPWHLINCISTFETSFEHHHGRADADGEPIIGDGMTLHFEGSTRFHTKKKEMIKKEGQEKDRQKNIPVH